MPISAQPNPDHFGGARVKTKRRSFMAQMGHTTTLNFPLEDGNGNPIDLTAFGFASGATEGASEPKPDVKVTIAEHVSREGAIVYADVVNGSTGQISVTIPANLMGRSGIWLMVFSIQTASGDTLFAGDAYLAINPNPGESCSGPGIPAIPEIRMFLRDYAQENELLDAVDFDVSEMAFAAGMCVNEWNEIPPPDGPRYTTESFPYRYHWLLGIVSKLFRIADEHYTRNAMKYEAGGKSLDDKNRAMDYRQKADRAWQEWSAFIRERKTIASVNGGYAEISGVLSPWYG